MEQRPAYDITIVIQAPNHPQHRIEMEYHSVRREDALLQPALASAVLLFEASEPTATQELLPYPGPIHDAARIPTKGTRRFPRWRVRRPVTVMAKHASRLEPIPGEVVVIGEGGMEVRLESTLEKGELVTVRMSGGGGQSVEVRGAVRNRRGMEHGLEFFALSQAEKARLMTTMLFEPTG
jgi:PilZ domain